MSGIVSEDDFLALVDRHFPRRHAGVVLGRGDDAAMVAWPGSACVTTDLFLEDVHYRRAYFTPHEVGHKALAVNVSDVAAMGCRPLGFVMGLICPAGVDAVFWDGVLTGMAALADAYDLPLVGGDLDRGPCTGLSITIWGEPGPSGRFLTRGSAAVDDVLVVVGDLGLARVGLTVLEEHGRSAENDWPAAVAAHVRPVPRVAEGLALADLPGVSAGMDVSDGLARDLPRFLPSGAGADLEIGPHAIHPEVAAFAAGRGLDPAMETVLGGEDYALLGAVRPADWPLVRRAVPQARVVGRVSGEPGIRVNGVRLTARGFDHFG